MRVFSPHRIAHISLWVMSQWLQRQKNSQMSEVEHFVIKAMFIHVSDCWCFLCHFAVSVHWDQSTVRHGALYTECLFCLHAACCNASERYSLLIRVPQSCWHGEYGSGLLGLFWKLYVEQAKLSLWGNPYTVSVTCGLRVTCSCNLRQWKKKKHTHTHTHTHTYTQKHRLFAFLNLIRKI